MPDLAADSVSQAVVGYADVADLYELCACRKEQTMRVCRSHEALRLHRDSWMDIASQHCLNEQFYRGLLEQVASHLGPEVFVSDDGSVQDSPLMLKIPEMVAALLAERESLRKDRDDYAGMCNAIRLGDSSATGEQSTLGGLKYSAFDFRITDESSPTT